MLAYFTHTRKTFWDILGYDYDLLSTNIKCFFEEFLSNLTTRY